MIISYTKSKKVLFIIIFLLIIGGLGLYLSMKRVHNPNLTGSFSIEKYNPNPSCFNSLLPSSLVLSVNNAVEMRFGNTREERDYATWEKYMTTKEWNLITGSNVKTVYGEFRDARGFRYQTDASIKTEPLENFTAKSKVTSFREINTVDLIMNIDNAVEMRFGNTPEERNLVSWKPYQTQKEWLVKTGPGEKIIYGEFRNSVGDLCQIEADPASTSAIAYNFSSGNNRWVSYAFDEGTNFNIFYPLTWEPTGGIGNQGYVWADNSRWVIDTPEEPDSILALMTMTNWLNTGSIDLRDATISVYLRGDDLNAKGAELYFWVVNDRNSRWHFISNPIKISAGYWGDKITFKLANQDSLWHRSWGNGNLDTVLREVDSFGFSFRGFPEGQEVTGKLSMDEFVINEFYFNE